MVWGAIAERKKGPLVLLDLGESDNEDRTLKGRWLLIGFYDEVVAKQRETVLVIEDGAPAYTSRIAKYACKILDIHTLTHLLRSSDLNHIESFSIGKLWDAVQSVWNAFTEEEIAHMTESIVERVNAVKAAKEHPTKF
ncbi:hypothetical protein C8Q75DRAFT_758288 [Abortiporus biennis]|nr:hypothetical protein C8Q75DRAFT_758288 [Abortiporus biennis]